MASSKKKTTMNKLNRERKLRERRSDKASKKLARANGEFVDPEQSEELFPNHFEGLGEIEAEPDPSGVGR